MHEFRVWAPNASRVRVRTGGREHPLEALPDGWFAGEVEDAGPGTDYAYLLDDSDQPLPDPASRWQPQGVDGPSRVYDQSAFRWTDAGWTGRDLPGAVIYEMHVGTFTPGASFDSAVEKLDHLVDLGVTHVELLPVNAVNGRWNWGYDGVDWYAVHEPIGGPGGLKRFVDACHGKGLAVVLDVVYNHLGPAGNYLPKYGPYLKQGRSTWGDLVNLDGAQSGPVRRFILDNVLMWLRDYHIDGLRLDAVHALQDASVPHLLEQMAIEVDALSAHLNRPLTLIAESDLNDPRMVTPREAGGYGIDGQWTDDVHHALHSNLTGETQGYYSDFGTLSALAKVFTHAFLHDGTFSAFRKRMHGRPVDRARTPGYRFVVCLQNHDQVGNRAVGDRLPELATPGLVKVGAVLLFTSPFTPMLWMGEEWAASTRWPFFTSHPQKELGEAVSKGRLEEFGEHGWDTDAMIDPQDPAAYHEAILNWAERDQDGHREVLDLYRRLARLRREEADLTDPRLDRVRVDVDENARWVVVHRGGLRVVANFAETEQTVPLQVDGEAAILLETQSADLTGRGLALAGHCAAVVRLG